jgi:RimJ/RimL family protein N-acetyltransferase
MIRDAIAADLPEITAFLTARMDQAMFPLANLRAHGLIEGAFASPDDHALRIWRIGRGLVALTRAGNILPYLDGSPNLSGLRAALHGQSIAGVIGPAASARPVIAALGLDRLPAATDRDEPGFGLPLADLRLPDHPGTTLRPLTPADLPLATDWRHTYIGEVLGSFGPVGRSKAEADLAFYLSRDSHRLLLDDGQPVAMTGFNATLPEIVQIGGVYTPAPLRGKGYARRAVALHLAEARAKGVTRAVLFAASDAAAQAYRAIGFQPTTAFTLFLLANPVQITA